MPKKSPRPATTAHDLPPAKRWAFPIAVVVVTAVVIGIILSTSNSGSDSSTSSAQSSNSVQLGDDPQRHHLRELVSREADSPNAIGDPDAPVGMMVFSDAQCPFCARWVHDTYPKIKPYIDSGKVRLVWHDAVIYGEDSQRGALASVAAGKQDKMIEFHQALFDGPDKATPTQLSTAGLKDIAAQLGMDVQQFEKDMNSDSTLESVEESKRLARSLGLSGTPAFIVDGKPVMGAQPTKVFTSIIDEAIDE